MRLASAALLLRLASAEPRDSAALRTALADQESLECPGRPTKGEGRSVASLAAVDPAYCHADSGGCYLLSHDALRGSIRSFECLGIRAEGASARDRNLPSFQTWGFLEPHCWSYARIRQRRLRGLELAPPDASLRRHSDEASQQWCHPSDSKVRSRLRVVLSARCVPFLLEDWPRRLSLGHMRRDALATTVVKLREGSGAVEEERRVVLVERVVLDAVAASSLKSARLAHPGVINPVVQLLQESTAPGRLEAPIAELLARHESSQRLRRGSLLALNLAVVSLNLLVAWKGVLLWQLITRVGVVDWIHRIQPHVPVTIRTARLLSWTTAPLRLAQCAVLRPLQAVISIVPFRHARRARRAVPAHERPTWRDTRAGP